MRCLLRCVALRHRTAPYPRCELPFSRSVCSVLLYPRRRVLLCRVGGGVERVVVAAGRRRVRGGASPVVPDEQERLLRRLLLVPRRARAPRAVLGAHRAQRAARARDATRRAAPRAPARHQHATQRVPTTAATSAGDWPTATSPP